VSTGELRQKLDEMKITGTFRSAPPTAA